MNLGGGHGESYHNRSVMIFSAVKTNLSSIRSLGFIFRSMGNQVNIVYGMIPGKMSAIFRFLT